jgi:hypothetical protein
MSKRATEERLSFLHGMTADAIIDELTRAQARAAMYPDDPACAVNPQLLDKAMKLLSITGITAPLAVPKAENVKAKLAALMDGDVDLDAEAMSGDRHH